LSHRLAKVYDETSEPIFDSVVVITDRRVLDRQLEDAIYQLKHDAGVVQKIDEDSNQLAEAIQIKRRIIIITLQKSPFIIDKVRGFSRGSYGIIIDEDLKDRAKNNSIDNFSFSFEDRFMDILIDRMTDRNFYQKMMENEEQRVFLMNETKEEVYYRLREQ